jgi:hypothetical protein
MLRRIVGYITFFFCFLFSLNISANSPYTLRDLEILESQKSFEEFLLHAKDIKPAQRNPHWKEMVGHMAITYVESKIRLSNFSKTHFLFIENLSSWPSLRKDEYFQGKRDKFALSFFKHCLSSKNNTKCLSQIERFWNSSAKKAETGLALSGLISHSFPKYETWPYISNAVSSGYGYIHCAKKSVQNEILEYLIKLNDKRPVHNPQVWSSVIEKLLHAHCWELMKKDYNQALLKLPLHKSTVLFQVLVANKSIQTELKDLYLTFFLLQRPEPGPVMNMAWSNLRELGGHYERRQKVLKTFLKYDRLPGLSFSHPKLASRKSIIQLFNINFPEYIDSYAKTCIKYRSGKGNFPYGNPTVECSDLFKLSEKEKFLSQPLHIKFSAQKH